MKLSIIVPIYNEAQTLKEILRRIERVSLGKVKKEIPELMPVDLIIMIMK